MTARAWFKLRSARQMTQWATARLRVRSARGATAIEYAILVAFIVAIIVVVVASIGNKTRSGFDGYDSQM